MKPALACLALAACSPTYNATEWTDAIPPKRFQGPAVATVFFLPPNEVRSICGQSGKPPQGMVIMACTAPKTSVMVLPDPCPYAATEYFARLVCHEAAHLPPYLWKHEA